MNAAYPPPNRAQDLSPISTNGSEWSVMNNYNGNGNNYPRPGVHPEYTRGDLATPPDSATLNGHPPRPLGPPGMEGSQRRRPSEAGSQQSSRAASVANSRSSDGTISDQQSRRYKRTEMELQQHYTVLKNFLKGGAPQPPRPNKARDKLLRLSPVQFHELSTDVFDELQRRQAATPIPGRPPRRDNVPPFLQPRQDFHEKRNQARQKLSSLQASRFRDLSTDVFCELERRFPHFGASDNRRRDSSRSVSSRGGRPPPQRIHTSNNSVASSNGFPPRNGSMAPNGIPQFDNPPIAIGPPNNEYGRPMPKQFQSNTITPNKSTMVEDDEDDEESERGTFMRDIRASDAFGLESAIASPNSDQDTPATSVSNPSRDMKGMQEKITALEVTLQEKSVEADNLKESLEKKVEEAQSMNKALQQEIEKLKSAHTDREKDLLSQISIAKEESKEDSAWKTRFQELDGHYQNLQTRYEEQQKITEEVGRQGQIFLSEMRAMAEAGAGGSLEREELLQQKVSKLEEEIKEWKARYADARTHAPNARAPSLGPTISQSVVTNSPHDAVFRRADGLVQDIHVTKFQISIDELLQSARTSSCTILLDHMRSVVVAVRDIALDIDNAKPETKTEEGAKQRIKLTATANNMITACKNFAAADGMSPVSLLDAAASHLSAAVVDLVRLVKIRPTVPDEHDLKSEEELKQPLEGILEPVNDAGYFNMSQRLRSESAAGSEYSALEQPQPVENSASTVAHDPQATPRLTNGVYENHDTSGSAGLGIQAQLKEDDTELQELKVSLKSKFHL